MIKSVFVDTLALIAIGNKRDTFHCQAIDVKDDLNRSKRSFETVLTVSQRHLGNGL
ncbi:MAG: hypothetical protein AB7S75_17010 [Desulfococcaceae bacterium]